MLRLDAIRKDGKAVEGVYINPDHILQVEICDDNPKQAGILLNVGFTPQSLLVNHSQEEVAVMIEKWQKHQWEAKAKVQSTWMKPNPR